MAHCTDRYQQPVVNAEAKPSGAQRSLALTTPSQTPSLAGGKRSLLLDIAEMGCIELVSVVDLQNAFHLAYRRGTFEVVDG